MTRNNDRKIKSVVLFHTGGRAERDGSKYYHVVEMYSCSTISYVYGMMFHAMEQAKDPSEIPFIFSKISRYVSNGWQSEFNSKLSSIIHPEDNIMKNFRSTDEQIIENWGDCRGRV